MRLAWWAFVAVAAKDFYEILGINRRARKDDIKKAYRELSLKYHPDKCEDKKGCEASFIEVSSAYEVLVDPEQRKIYDQAGGGEKGEEALKEHGKGDGQAAAMFRQFFGREPNGKVRIRRGPMGQMFFEEEGEQGPKEDLYKDAEGVDELDSSTFSAYVRNRDEPWLVLFYKPNNDECREMAPEYRKVGKTWEGIVKIGAVNCIGQSQLCTENSIDHLPALRWYSEDPQAEPDIPAADTTAKSIGRFMTQSLKDFTTAVADKNQVRAWLDQATGPAVILFTDKKSTPPMWKALSRQFMNRASLAVMLGCDKSGVFKSALEREYDVRVPQILLLDRLAGKKEVFTNQMKTAVLALWFQKHIAKTKNAGPAATFKEWTKPLFDDGVCSPKDGQFCFVWLKSGKNSDLEAALQKLAEKYRRDPIKLIWVNVEKHFGILDNFAFGDDFDGEDKFLAFRPKRHTYKLYDGPFEFGALDAFVDGTINGGPLSSKLQGQVNLEL